MRLFKYPCGCVGFENPKPAVPVHDRTYECWEDVLVLRPCGSSMSELHLSRRGLFTEVRYQERRAELTAEEVEEYVKAMNDAFSKAKAYDDVMKRLMKLRGE